MLPLVFVLLPLLFAPLGARAASIDRDASTLAGNAVSDLSEDGVLGVGVTLETVAELELAVVVDEAEKTAPLVLEVLIANASPERLRSLALSLSGGATLSSTGVYVADAAPSTDGISPVADGATFAIPSARRPYLLELADPPDAVGWRIDAAGVPEGQPFTLRITPAPEPDAGLVEAAALAALLACARRARRRPGPGPDRGGALPRLLAMLAMAATLAPVSARAATLTVTDSVDDAFGSLRNTLETFASPGDTVVFDVSEVVLDRVLVVPSDLDGLTIQGPVTLRPAPGKNGVLRVQADGVTLTGGIVFEDVQVGTVTVGAQSNLSITGNRFEGASPVSLRNDIGCTLQDNVMNVEPGGKGDHALALFRTRDCTVVGNEITTSEWAAIDDDDSKDLVIRANTISAGIFSRQRSGEVLRNDAAFVYVVPNDLGATEPLLVAENTVDYMRVQRTNVDVVDNTIDATAGDGRGRVGVALGLVNDDSRGGSGTFSARDNVVTGGRVGVLYGDADGANVPGELLRNDVSACGTRGIVASRPKGTRIAENLVDGCGTSPARSAVGILIGRASTAEVAVEDNTVTGQGGDGMAVSAPEATVSLRRNTVTGASLAGILVEGAFGPPVVVEDATLTDNGDPGLWVRTGSRATVSGGAYRRNGNAGILLAADTRVSISQVGMSDSTGPGIDLGPAGVTPNEETKIANADTDWPEDLRLDVPTMAIEGATIPGARVEGYVVEADPRTGNPMNGEGTIFLGSVLADGAGHFAFPSDGAVACTPGTKLTFTATTTDALPTTSEFSPDFDCDEPPLDSDGDSVTDDRDLCPDTPEGTPVDGDGCPLDADEDGVPDGSDVCPGTAPGTTVESNGCAENVDFGASGSANCNDAPTCMIGPSGGVCSDCRLEVAPDVGFDCFDDGASCNAQADAGLGCLDCDATAYAGLELDCSEAQCRYDIPSDTLSCDGPAGGCDLTLPGGDSTSCPDVGCEVLVTPSLRDADRAGRFTVQKLTIGGDGEFEFFGAAGLAGTIATNGGVGTKVLQTVFGVNVLSFVEVEWRELVPEGWDLESIECDSDFTEIDAMGRPGAIVVFDPGDVATCTFTNRRTGPPTVRTDLGLELPEAAERSGTFGLPAGDRVTLAGDNGFVVVDALTGEVPFAGVRRLSFVNSFSVTQPVTGALVLENPDGSGEDTYFTYGPNGTSQSQFFVEIQDFGFTQIGFDALTDAHHLGSDPSAPEALTVSSTRRIGRLFYEEDPSGDFLRLTSSTLASGGDFLEVSPLVPVSAYAFQDGTHVLVALDGAPGELVLLEPDEDAGDPALSVVGALENGPRRVRCADGVCAVSNFHSDSLSIVLWDGGGTAFVGGTVAVGDGPVGISVRPFGANALVASTGFGDDTIWLTELAPDGTVVANESLLAPDGCTAPGHALWLRDAQESLVVTCNGSDAYAVLTPGPVPD